MEELALVKGRHCSDAVDFVLNHCIQTAAL